MPTTKALPPASRNKKAGSAPKAAPAPVKSYSAVPWKDEGEGERILLNPGISPTVGSTLL